MADDVQVPREVANWVEGAGEEELRQEDKREEEVCRALIRQEADDQRAERCAENGNLDQRWNDGENLRQGERNSKHDTEEHHRECLREGNQ